MQTIKKSRKNLHALQIVALLLLTVLIGGCNGVGTMDVDTTVYSSDRCDITISFQMPTQFLSLAGGTNAIESKLDDMVNSADEGEKVTWRRDKDVAADEVGYIIESKGSGCSSGDEGFSITPTMYDGKDALRFDGDFSDFTGMSSFTFTLHGGEILESNGSEIDKGTVRWDNPHKGAYAVFTPKNRFNWLYIGIGIAVVLGCSGALLIGVLLVFLLYRRRNVEDGTPKNE